MHFIKHFNTVNKHRFKVFVHCVKAGIFFQGLTHDLSKYSPTEFIEGARFYLGYKSPTEREREVYGYSKAWLHHKGRNRHHFEYWTDYNPATRSLAPVKMPIRYVKEMFCDRVAASKVYMGEKYTVRYPISAAAEQRPRCIRKRRRFWKNGCSSFSATARKPPSEK